ncbi:MAG: ABC transporter permease [Chloroflexi bacterium]|nr:MAG: ABC transporter permease [Chloroflexota bacterium]
MRALAILLRKELVEQWRTMRLPSAIALFLFVGISSPLLARFTPQIIQAVAGAHLAGLVPPPQVGDAVAQFVKNMGQFGALMAIVLAMGSVAVEKERGTAAFVLSKPVGRVQFLAAKLLALTATLAAGVLAAGLATYLYTGILFAWLRPGFLVTAALTLVALTVFATFTFAASTLTGSTAAAAGSGFVALVVAGAVSVFPHVGGVQPVRDGRAGAADGAGLAARPGPGAAGRPGGDRGRPGRGHDGRVQAPGALMPRRRGYGNVHFTFVRALRPHRERR